MYVATVKKSVDRALMYLACSEVVGHQHNYISMVYSMLTHIALLSSVLTLAQNR